MGEKLPDLGSAAEWFSAAAAAGAFVMAVIAVYLSWRSSTQLRIQQRQKQASELHAWSITGPEITENGPTTRRGVLLSNSSTSPVFDVVVDSTYSLSKNTAPEVLSPLTITMLPPGEFVAFRDSKYPWTFPRQRSPEHRDIQAIMNNPGWRVTRLSFTDGQGIRWEREGATLREVHGRSEA